MGSFVYGSAAHTIPCSDEALAYVKSIVIMKLRRNESFTITYPRAVQGRVSIWVHPSISLQFVFDEPHPGALDRDRLELLMQAVYITGDLNIAHMSQASP